jgi:pimeloyl-ACP methyl ester carboxylesterase
MAADQLSPWILIRGLIRARYHWGDFPARLQQQLPASTPLVMPELAGNGERWRERTPFSIHAMMLDLRQQVKSQHTGHQPLTLVTISMGAMIGAEWARCFPNEVNALHMINTSFSNLSTPWSRMRAHAFLSLSATLFTGGDLEAAILRWTSSQPRPALAKEWNDYAQQHPLSLRNALAQLLAASRYHGPLSAPISNVHLYHSLGDQLVNPRCTARIAERWQSPLSVHQRAGHDLPLDAPEWLINEILQV